MKSAVLCVSASLIRVQMVKISNKLLLTDDNYQSAQSFSNKKHIKN
jgi:hypothetical protein